MRYAECIEFKVIVAGKHSLGRELSPHSWDKRNEDLQTVSCLSQGCVPCIGVDMHANRNVALDFRN